MNQLGKEAFSTLKEFKQYSATFELRKGWEIPTQHGGDTIPLSHQTQKGYFHLQGGKVNGDAESLIVSDGFRPSLVDMVAYMTKEEPKLLEEVHQHAIVARRLETETHCYENETYPALQGGWLYPLSSLGGTKDKEKALESAIRDGVVSLYGELEWALHYYFQKNPLPPSLLAPYLQGTPKENRKALSRILKKSKIKEGKVDLISQFTGRTSSTNPTMTTLLPLMLLAWEQDKSSILSQLRKKLPDFYLHLSYLYPIRNKAIHEGIRTISLEKYSFYQDFGAQWLELLLPDWKKNRYLRKEVNENNSDTNRRLLALQALHQEFGFAYVNQYLSQEMLDTFLRLSPHHRQPATPAEYIKALCLLLELSFAQALGGVSVPLPTGEENPLQGGTDLTAYIVEELESRYNITLPSSLRTVKSYALEKALSGQASTLGAEVLAFLYVHGRGGGKGLVTSVDLEVIQQIITLRGHGNQMEISPLLLEETELKKLRSSVVSMMKGLVKNV